MNARNRVVSAQAKIDVNTGPSVNLQFGGSLNYSTGTNWGRNGSLLNFGNFGEYNKFGNIFNLERALKTGEIVNPN